MRLYCYLAIFVGAVLTPLSLLNGQVLKKLCLFFYGLNCFVSSDDHHLLYVHICNIISMQRRSCPITPGLMDFAFRLVNSVLNLPDGQAMFFEKFKLMKNCEINSACQKALGAS